MSNFILSEKISNKEIPSTADIAEEVRKVIDLLNIDLTQYGFEKLDADTNAGTVDGKVFARTPITGESYGCVKADNVKDVEIACEKAMQAFLEYRKIPSPVRGEFVRHFGNLLRQYKTELGFIVSVEAGKIISEGLGEVQEMIDIADFALGLSRQLYGKTIASERPNHVMRETWHPLGPVGAVTAFNFPVAVWAWNACIAFVCGDPVVFKPSDKSVIAPIICHELAKRAARECGIDENISQLLMGGPEIAVALAENENIALLSVTGSVAAGSALAPIVQKRYGKTLLELGGNNAMIVTPSADLDLALRAITFAAAGTAGQRCTTLRRLIVHRSISQDLLGRISRAYETLNVGNPLFGETLVGPIIAKPASDMLDESCSIASEAGEVLVDPVRVHESSAPNAFYRRPGLVKVDSHIDLLEKETFAPLLYVIEYETLDEAIEMNNSVPQGLSSSIFTNDVREAETFISNWGSDCGIANVNIGPSGAEIGGAFGGEKTTGGGRESGSDAWKTYMRVQTNTINFGDTLPLAQGVEFL
ncbi:MAG: aldehyde dehydrogenase family protein [Acidimicrobiia bacterium]